jgi:hypothetical protein
VLSRPARDLSCGLAPARCQRAIAVTERWIVPSRLRMTKQVETLHGPTI